MIDHIKQQPRKAGVLNIGFLLSQRLSNQKEKVKSIKSSPPFLVVQKGNALVRIIDCCIRKEGRMIARPPRTNMNGPCSMKKLLIACMCFFLSLSPANAEQKSEKEKRMAKARIHDQNQTDLDFAPPPSLHGDQEISAVFFDSSNITAEIENDLISGKLLLFNIEVTEDVYTDTDEINSGQVKGFFCRFSMDEQKDDPSKGMQHGERSVVIGLFER